MNEQKEQVAVGTPTRFEFPRSRIYSGADALAGLAEAVHEAGASRVLVVAGANVSANLPLRERVTGNLGAALAGWFGGVVPYVPEAAVSAAVDLAREVDADAIVALGGGSAMDMAKSVVAVLSTNLGVVPFAERYHVRSGPDGVEIPALPDDVLPVIAIPSTFSGSELNGASSVLVEGRGRLRLRSLALTPAAVVYDPWVPLTGPRSVLRSTGINALDHGIEISYARGANTLIRELALASVRVLARALPALADEVPDQAAMIDLQYGGALAATWMNTILVLERRGHGLAHAICHVLGSRHGMQQGEAHAVMMPFCMRLMAPSVGSAMGELAEALGASTTSGSEADAVIGRFVEIRDGLGLPSRLRDHLSRSDLEDVAEHTMQDFSTRSAPRTVTLDDVRGILDEAW